VSSGPCLGNNWDRRLRAFGKLDLEIMNTLAPGRDADVQQPHLFSNRVDPHSLVYSGVYSDWSIPGRALK
jgi:hypothetical protein